LVHPALLEALLLAVLVIQNTLAVMVVLGAQLIILGVMVVLLALLVLALEEATDSLLLLQGVTAAAARLTGALLAAMVQLRLVVLAELSRGVLEAMELHLLLPQRRVQTAAAAVVVMG
jgi:hypothetical protein